MRVKTKKQVQSPQIRTSSSNKKGEIARDLV